MAASNPATPVRLPATAVAPRPRRQPLPWLWPGILLGGLVPLFSIVLRGSQGALGADPIAQALNEFGLTALIFLMAALACTPARRLWGWTWQMRVRRELGLFAFFYVSLHFTTYLMLDQVFNLVAIGADIIKRPFITVGFSAFVLLIPVALTSTDNSVKRLGYRTWQRIHQLVYVAGVLAVIHFIWRVKIDVSQPLTYAFVLAALFAVRIGFWLQNRYDQGAKAR